MKGNRNNLRFLTNIIRKNLLILLVKKQKILSVFFLNYPIILGFVSKELFSSVSSNLSCHFWSLFFRYYQYPFIKVAGGLSLCVCPSQRSWEELNYLGVGNTTLPREITSLNKLLPPQFVYIKKITKWEVDIHSSSHPKCS